MAKDKKSKNDRPAPSKITDARFANFETDPRFRLPSKNKAKTTIDKRFARMLKDDDFTNAGKVDRYGRKLKSDVKKKALQRLYKEEEGEEEQGHEGGEDGEEGEDTDIDDDEIIQRELRATNAKYDPARGGGFSESDTDSDDDEDVEEAEAAGPSLDRFREEQADVETGEVTNRIAIVNLDWDHIKSVDLFALFSSFAPAGGRVEKVSIYLSEFGKERVQREELEGPPRELFRKRGSATRLDEEDSEDSDDDSESGGNGEDEQDSDEEARNDLLKEGDDRDFDSDALRTYQLDRLRYYYAVMVCSDPATAQKVYEATDGTEYLASSNFLDLRFVPDDVTFDDEPRDECGSVPAGYKPVDFVTDALQHSKVKLTWDMHPEEHTRKDTMQKAFSGSRADIAENDLRAYLASDSDSDGGEEEAEAPSKAVEKDEEPRLSKKELARQKMRAALGLADEPVAKMTKDGPVGDMQITFAPALTEKESGKRETGEETTIEKYMRKERERKAKRKEKALAKREGDDKSEGSDGGAEDQGEDLGFEDPFFTSEEPEKTSKSAVRKEERLKKREAREAEEAANAAQKAQLELLMADNTDEQATHLDHFDMNEILRQEKRKGKKKAKKGKQDKEERGGLQEDFQLNVNDPRFKAVFDSHEFAIDPSNPKFKATSGMKKLLEEKRKRKAGDGGDEAEQAERELKKAKGRHGDEGQALDVLVKKVKKRSAKK